MLLFVCSVLTGCDSDRPERSREDCGQSCRATASQHPACQPHCYDHACWKGWVRMQCYKIRVVDSKIHYHWLYPNFGGKSLNSSLLLVKIANRVTMFTNEAWLIWSTDFFFSFYHKYIGICGYVCRSETSVQKRYVWGHLKTSQKSTDKFVFQLKCRSVSFKGS